MSDDRTAEQIEADDELAAALDKACRAYAHLEEGWAIGDWVLCLEMTGYSDEAVGRERYAYILPRDFLPTHRIIGLMSYCQKLVERSDDD